MYFTMHSANFRVCAGYGSDFVGAQLFSFVEMAESIYFVKMQGLVINPPLF